MTFCDTVYCMYCSKLIPKEEAAFVFGSGFYRKVYPLAGCRDCLPKIPRDCLPEALRR